MEAVRARRVAIEKAMDVELFGPPLQPGEVEQRIRRLQDSDLFEVGSLRTEVQFLLLGLRGIYLMSRAIRANLKGPERNCVRTAVSRFEKRLPEPLLLRNIHEHLDEYILGKGRNPLTPPVEEGLGGMIEDKGVAYYIGGPALRHLGDRRRCRGPGR